MTVEKITYRIAARGPREHSILPPFGAGYGLGDDLGILLNQTIRGSSVLRTSHKSVVGVVIAEDAKYVSIEFRDGRKLKIPVPNIIERTVVA